MERKDLVFRPTMALLPVGVLYLASLARFLSLQGASGEEAAASVRGIVTSEMRQQAPRGTLLDRAGRVLAEDRPVWNLVMDARPDTRRWIQEQVAGKGYEAFQNARTALAALAEASGAEVAEWERHVFSTTCQRRVLQRGLSELTAQRLRGALAACSGNGLRLERGWQRVYPQGRALAHAVGLVGSAEGEERRAGVSGLEEALDGLLAGSDGLRRALRVAGENGVNPLISDQPGSSLPAMKTSLDAALGAFARAELAEARRKAGARWACAVAMDARTGEVLLLAAVPDYDPNAPGVGMETEPGPSGPRTVGWMLPAVWPLEPGSTVKPFIVARALAEGVVSREERFENHGGAWHLPGRVIHNASEVPHQAMTPREVLVHSSNIGAAKIGMRLGSARVRALWEDLGVHSGTGLINFDGNPGLFPSDKDWQHPSAERWCVASTSYGHAFSMTPLRLASAWSALVNGGELMRPLWFAGQTPVVERRVFPEAVAREVSGWIEAVVADRKDKVLPRWPDLRWGGKSGTAKKVHTEGYDLLFTAFGPVEEPEIVVVVVVDDPKNGKPRGSLMAGPSAGRILRRALELRGTLVPESRLESLASQDMVRQR